MPQYLIMFSVETKDGQALFTDGPFAETKGRELGQFGVEEFLEVTSIQF